LPSHTSLRRGPKFPWGNCSVLRLPAPKFTLRLLSKPLSGICIANSVSQDALTQGGGHFPATRWSVVEAARSQNPAERARALDTLFAAYWKPVYKYVRLRWNRLPEDAQDLTQGFFMGLLKRNLLARFDPQKSRLRTYLRLCVDSFAANAEKAARRQKRGGNTTHLPLDFEAAEGELNSISMDPAAIPSPDSLEEFFEKEWIRGLFALAVEDLRTLCVEREREKTFHLFEAYDLDGNDDLSYEQLSREYGISITDLTNALAWARREFRRIALERLQEICAREEEFHREARSVFGCDVR
jgi:RNA polymerase sigma factor (sigma-70 family)